MRTKMLRILASTGVAASLVFGTAAAVQTADAQITVKCYREFCAMGPDGMESCVRQQIPCPSPY